MWKPDGGTPPSSVGVCVMGVNFRRALSGLFGQFNTLFNFVHCGSSFVLVSLISLCWSPSLSDGLLYSGVCLIFFSCLIFPSFSLNFLGLF